MMPKRRVRVLMGFILFLVMLPFVPLVLSAFSRSWFFPELIPTQWSLEEWRVLFAPRTGVLRAFGNSLQVALGTTLFSIVIGIPAGRALGLYEFRGKRLVQFLVLAPTIVPVVAVAMGIHITFIRYRLTDTLLGVILVHLIPVLPYVVLILSGVFANYNTDYEAQARTLGANWWQLIWRVMLPLIWPGLVVGGLFAFIISWSQYLLTLVIGGGQVVTLPVLLVSFASGGDTALASALSLIFILPALLILVIISRYLVGDEAVLGGLGSL